jgi:lipopolysaccharide/colanic/teichoic acid biosynthesis glycosyltransferase
VIVVRALDLLVASLGLLALAPLTLLITIAIRLDSSGPGITRQRRARPARTDSDTVIADRR